MEQIYSSDFSANLVISDEVIASIAMNAAKDVDGFGSFALRPVDYSSIKTGVDFLKNGPDSESLKYVKVESDASEVKIGLYINLKNGAKIRDVCSEIQTAVKSAIQNMSGKVVTRVDVNVSGLDTVKAGEEKAE
jgi:uncharacterized alkaline shock family protein YloU